MTGAFTVFATRWDTFAARDREGNGLCSGIDKEGVIFWAREHLNGFPEQLGINYKHYIW